MKTFVITPDDNITAYASRELANASLTDGAVVFATEAELIKLAAAWPSARLLQIWNSIPGLAPVRKFTDRKTGLARIWKSIQSLDPAPDPAPPQPPAAHSRPRAPRRTGAQGLSRHEGSKRAQIIALMRRSGGVTLQEIVLKTGWQAHTVRGFVSGTLIKKLGLKVESFKSDTAERTYRIGVQPEAGTAEV